MYAQIMLLRTVQYALSRRCMSVYTQSASSTKLEEEDKLQQYLDKHAKAIKWDDAKPFDSIPGPKPLPVIGNLFRFMPVIGSYYNVDLISLQYRLRKQYGDIVKLSDMKFRKNSIYLFDADDIATVCRNEGTWPERPSLETLLYYRTKVRTDIFRDEGGIISGQGKPWYELRSIANAPLMLPRTTEQYLPAIDEVGQEFAEKIRILAGKNAQNEMPENFLNELNKYSLETINFLGMNKRLGLLQDNDPTGDSERFIRYVGEFVELMHDLEFKVSLWKIMNTPTWKRYIKVVDFILEFELKHFNDVLSRIDWQALNSKPDSELSILERLLKKDKNRTFSIFFDMMFGSVDTSSRVIAATLYFLCKNQDKQAKLREELRRLLPTKDTPITKDIINEMAYLRAVIKETQRFAPINVFGARVSQTDLVLSGYQVPKGVELLFAHLVLCRDEKYFYRANDFIPERWLRGKNEELTAKDFNPFVYLPFGFGIRMCVGRRLAQLQMETLLARIVRNFHLTWPHDEMKWSVSISHRVASPLKFHMKPLE